MTLFYVFFFFLSQHNLQDLEGCILVIWYWYWLPWIDFFFKTESSESSTHSRSMHKHACIQYSVLHPIIVCLNSNDILCTDIQFSRVVCGLGCSPDWSMWLSPTLIFVPSMLQRHCENKILDCALFLWLSCLLSARWKRKCLPVNKCFGFQYTNSCLLAPIFASVPAACCLCSAESAIVATA